MTTTVKFLNNLTMFGSKIVSFSDNETRILMVFGAPSGPNKNKTTDELMDKKLLSQIPELFKENPESTYKNQAIFISNLHIDHIDALKFLKAGMPVYLSLQSRDLYNALIEAGEKTAISNLKIFDYEKAIEIGSFTITFFHSTHDVIDASTIKISDSEGHIFGYFGDQKYDESCPEQITHRTRKLINPQMDLLLIEGADFSLNVDQSGHKEKNSSSAETNLIDNFIDKLGSNHLVVVNADLQNIERLNALEKAARDFGRPIVWEKSYSSLLKKFFPDSNPLTLGKDIDLPEIIAYPEDYVLQNSYSNLDNLKNFYKPIFLQIDGEPLGDHDPSYEIQQNKLNDFSAEFFDIGIFKRANKEKLLKIAKQINAKITIPLHSFNFKDEAALLKAEGLTVKLPEKNENIEF
ncbi:hydrolase [Oenococcus sp. UCMA 14587]|nr:hydrolase [Oenococcus sp. UCMA 14587]